MESQEKNTVKLVSKFEKSMLTFTKEHSRIIKENLDHIRKLENDYFNSLQAADEKNAKKIKQSHINLETRNKAAHDQYEKAIAQANVYLGYAKDASMALYKSRLEEIEREYKSQFSYVERLLDIYSDYIRFFSLDEKFYLNTRLRKEGLYWFAKYSDCGKYIRYANNSYDSIFSKEEVDLMAVHRELSNLVKFITECEKLSLFKRNRINNDILAALGNINTILLLLEKYIEECSDYTNNRSKDIMNRQKREAEEKRDKKLVEGEKAYQIIKSDAIKNRDRILSEEALKLQPELEALNLELSKEKLDLKATFEEEKRKNEEAFIKKEKKLKDDIILCLDTEYSIKIVKEFEKKQSHINNYSDTEKYQPVEENNSYVRLGYVQFDYAHHPEMRGDLFIQDILNKYYEELDTNGIFHLPYIVDFENFSNMQLECEDEDVINTVPAVRSIVTRLFCNMLAGRIKFTFLDLAAQGQTFAPFMQFISASPISRNIINQGTCTDMPRADALLEGLENNVRDINSNIYTRDYSSVIEYNNESEPNILPINIIIVMNYPEQLSEKAIMHIERIIRHSKRCGFHFLFVGSGKSDIFSQSSFKDIMNDISIDNINNNSIDFDRLDPLFCRLKYITTYEYQLENSFVNIKFDEMISEQKLHDISEVMMDTLEKSSSVKIAYSKINKGFSTNSAKEDIRLPFALVGSSDIKSLIFGDKYAGYAAVVGVPRTGKSNALHVLIMSAVCNYSPDELQIYLLDYKLGVEAYKYSEYRLPHFKVISTTKNVIFGINVISSIDDIMEERTALFNENKCVNYTEYYEKCQNQPELRLPKLPRILVIIDEMHEIIKKNDDKENNFSECMARLIKTSPSYGIHMILASQTVTDWNFGEAFDLITSAIVFKCAPESEKKILGKDSSIAQQIPTSDQGHAIYSADRQNPNNNQYVRVGYLNNEIEDKMLKQVEEKYKDVECLTRINASSLVNRADNPIYKLVNGMKTTFETDTFTIGENLDLDDNSDIKLNGNMLMIGDDQEMARNFAETLLISILCNNIVNRTSNKIFFIDLMEFKNTSKQSKDLIFKLSNSIGEPYVKYFACSQFKEARETVMQAAANSSSDSKLYFFIFGLSDAQKELLGNMLFKDDPNIRIIVWCNTFECFLSHVASDYYNLMKHRLIFCSPESDVKLLTSRARDLTESNYALYRDISSPFTAREYAPYKNKNERWIEELTAILKNY